MAQTLGIANATMWNVLKKEEAIGLLSNKTQDSANSAYYEAHMKHLLYTAH